MLTKRPITNNIIKFMLHLSYVVFFGHGTVSFVSIVSSLDASDRENY